MMRGWLVRFFSPCPAHAVEDYCSFSVMVNERLMQKGCYLTSAVSGTGGTLRAEPEDFCVEEIPLDMPRGVGEHLYLYLEKRGLSTLEAVRAVARLFGSVEADVGYAGMKDARAVTRQWISVRAPGAGAERKLGDGEISKGLRVLEIQRGRSKLRRGDLRGNRFDIRVRGVLSGSVDRAREVMEILAVRGLPNGFGDQRFGARRNSAEVGRALALGEWSRATKCLLGPSPAGGRTEKKSSGRATEAALRFEAGDLKGALDLYTDRWRAERRVLTALVGGASAERALRAIPRRERALFASAFQAVIFNACLAARLTGGAHDRIMPGDVVINHKSGKARRVGDPGKEAGALERFEASPAGPLIGEKMLEARGEPGGMEAAALRALNLTPGEADAGLARMGARGGRRPYRARIKAVEIVGDGDDLRLRFELPPGSYATEVLREVMKVEPPVGAGYHLEIISQVDSIQRDGGEDP